MAFDYTFTKNQDVYTLANNSLSERLDYVLEKSENCSTYATVTSGTLARRVTDPFTVSFTNLEDGEYRLTVTDETPVSQVVNFKFYVNLQKSTISDISLALCGCECSGCAECQDCELMLSAITKWSSYASLSATDYGTNYTLISDYLKCILGDEISCVLVNEKYKGSADTTATVKILLSLYYLVMYYTEFGAAVDTAEEEYIKTKFEFETVSKCILKLGINLSDIEALV